MPESYFTSGETLMGVWKFLGQDITVKPDLQSCADRGVPGQCEAIDLALLRSPVEYTRRAILRLTDPSLAVARSGKWKGTGGKFRVLFMSRGERTLAYLDQVFRHSKGQNFSCEVVPMSCTAKRLPKKELAKSFAQIFAGRKPRVLEHTARRSKKENANFQRLVKSLPDTYVKYE